MSVVAYYYKENEEKKITNKKYKYFTKTASKFLQEA